MMVLKQQHCATLLLLIVAFDASNAWTMSRTPRAVYRSACIQSNRLVGTGIRRSISRNEFNPKASAVTLFSSPSDEVPKRKRKRKKKVQVVDVEDTGTIDTSTVDTNEKETLDLGSPAPLDLKPREDAPVQLEVKNILAQKEPEPSAVASAYMAFTSIFGSDETSAQASSNTQASSTATDKSVDMTSFSGRPADATLDQLLEDARLMTEEEKEANKDKGIFSDEEGSGVKAMIGDTLSTIVTVDFFVVCGFLLWFLLGIFCSYILKDDTIQIAFNNNFETLVQPALGVLMIAAIGGNFFKEEEKEYDL